jgi:hypothetical protein
MSQADFTFAQAYLLCLAPFLAFPTIIALIILIRYRYDQITIAAGLFTLKPTIASLIYSAILAMPRYGTLNDETWGLVDYGLFLAPGLGLTAVLVVFCWPLIVRSRVVTILLVLDVVWLLSRFPLHPLWPVRPGLVCMCDSILQLLPTANAFVALALVREHAASHSETRIGRARA